MAGMVKKNIPPKKSPSKAKIVAKKSSAPQKTAPAKKAVAKAAPAKKVVTKAAPAKKAVAKAAPAKKVVTKAVPAKKTVAKTAPAKKVVAKATPAKKVVAKVAPKAQAPKAQVTPKRVVTSKVVARPAIVTKPKTPTIPTNFPTFGEKWGRTYLAQPKKFANFPDLLDTQKQGYASFLENYVAKLFDDINPVYDIAGEKLALTINEIKVSDPIDPIDTCKKKELTYGGIISGKMKLVDSETNKVLFNKRINIGILPLMTKWGSYVINGVERVIIAQIIRSYGIFFNFDKRNLTQSFKIIPERGSWIEVFTEKSGTIVVRVNNSRKFLVTSLLRVFGFETDESIKALFDGLTDDEDFDFIQHTLNKDTITSAQDAAIYIYNKMRPGEIIDADSAMDYIKSIFLSQDRMFLGQVARRKINVKIGVNKEIKKPESQIFDAQDLIASLRYLINLANKKRGFFYDDIDHLANRRIRSMGETLYAHLSPVMRKFVKSVKGKLSVLNLEEPIKLTSLANFKIIDNSIKSFFATSQLSQFLDQINPLAEIEHKRRITAL